MQPNDDKNTNGSGEPANQGAGTTAGDSILPPPPITGGPVPVPQTYQDGEQPQSAAVAPEPVEEPQPEIDSFTTFEVAGIKYILGLGLDSKVYNWDVTNGRWKPFVLKPKNTLDDVL